MTEHDYLLAWSLYGAAALGCLLVWLRMTGWLWRWLREPLRVIVAVLLFSPTVVDPAKDLFAPAIAITALDLLLKVGNNAWRAAADLSMYAMLAMGVYLLFALIRWPFERLSQKHRQERAAAASADEPTLREVMQRESAAQTDTRIDQHGDGRAVFTQHRIHPLPAAHPHSAGGEPPPEQGRDHRRGHGKRAFVPEISQRPAPSS